MQIVRRVAALSFALALAALSSVPAAAFAAMRCDSRSACPMMAKRGAPCHGTPGQTATGMTAAMSCCETRATATPSPAGLGIAPAAVADVPGGAPVTAGMAAVAPPLSDAWRAHRHGLGLFTLHAVWRI